MTRHARSPRPAVGASPASTGDPPAPGCSSVPKDELSKAGQSCFTLSWDDPGAHANKEMAVSLPYLFSSQMKATVAGSP